MQYFKNVELAKLYPVSESAVRKWIESARQGKVDLQLYEHNGKFHIANTAKNIRVIEGLVERGQKYKNTRGRKVVTPKAEFYNLYNRKQILDIISNIEIHNELPLQYSYFDGGVEYWDSYTKRLWKEEGENSLNATVKLLCANFGSLDELLEGINTVNIIDVGVGNGMPVKELLAHLLYNRGIMGRYIGIDISKGMLHVAQDNIKEWFEGKIPIESHERDINYERFRELIASESKTTANLILVFGGTLKNLREPKDALRTIYNSIGGNDRLVIVSKLDSNASRRYFDFSTEPGMPRLAQNHRLLLDLLNIDESLYEVEQGYDEVKKARYIRIRLKVDLSIPLAEVDKVVELHKDEKLLVWRAWHQSDLEAIAQLQENGFALLQASTTKDRHYLLTISEIAGDSQLGP